MLFYLFILFVVIFIVFLKKQKIKIKWKTILKKGFHSDRGIFGIYCYCGKQGSFKTYSVVEFLNEHKDMKIYANMHSLKNLDYTYINGFDDLLSLRRESNCIIFYDEIFTALTKSSKINTDILDFLSQMRKRKIIFLTTAQEWAEIPLTFRRYCRYQINCRPITIPFLSTFILKNFLDAENMKWSNDDNDFVAPLISNTISKSNLKIANSYDTYEQIGFGSSFKNEPKTTKILNNTDKFIDKDFWDSETLEEMVDDDYFLEILNK